HKPKTPATVTAGFDEPVTTPVLSEGYPKSQNTSDAPDTDAATEAVLVGTADPKAVIKVQDKDGNPLTPTATADDKGKFTLTIPKADLAKGPFKLIAGLEKNGTTESSDPTAEIPVAQTVQPGTPVANPTDKATPSTDKGGYPNDSTPPPAPTIDTGVDGDGKVTVDLPADAKNGDKVTITYTDEATGKEKEVVVTKVQDNWKVPADSPIPQDKINGNNLEIPADSVKDNSEVTARTQDLAGNLSEKKKDTSKYDEVTATPTLTVNAIDTATKADNTIDALVVTGTVKKDNTPENGAKVKLLHNGAEVVPTDKGLVANDAGEYKAVLVKKGTEKAVVDKLKAKYPDHTIIEVEEVPTTGNLTAIAQKEGKAQSPNTDAAIPTTLTNDTTDHPLDAANPTAPGLQAFGFADGPEKQGDVEVTFPTDAVEGDTVAVTITPPAGSADTTQKVITFTKGKDAWTSNPALPAGYTVDGNKLHIESTSIPDGATVSATSTDLAGKTAEGQAVTAQQDPRQTKLQDEVTVAAVDTDGSANTTAETITITGKAEAGAKVTLYKSDGTTKIAEFDVPAAQAGANGEPAMGDFTFTVPSEHIPTTDTAKDFVIKAKVPNVASEKSIDVDVTTAPGKQSDLDKVTLTGTVADFKNQELELHKDGVKVGSVTTNESGEFTFNITKGDANNNATDGNVKVTDLPQTDALTSFVVKKPDGTAVAFNGTAERKTEGSQHTGDNTAPELDAQLSVVLPNRPVNVTKAEPVDTKDEKANALDIKLPNTPVDQDELHVIVKTEDGEKKVVFTYENGDWKKGGDTLNVGEIKPTRGTDGKYSISIPAKALKENDTYTVIHRDLAGNAKVYSAPVSEKFDSSPEKVDAPVVYTGTKTTEAGNGENMLVTKFAGKDEPTKPAAVNAGDIVFRPGLDNTKLEVSFVKKDSDLASVDKARDVIYGKLEGDKFKFYKDSAYNTPVEEGLVTEITGQDGYTHYVIPADKVVDNSQFTVVGINEGGKRSDNPADVATSVAQAEYTAGFDDKTDKAVGDPAIAQANATSDITITPTAAVDTDGDNSNINNNADANKVAVKFDASHLAGTSAEALGLKVNGEKGADNQIIVALKQPNGKWKLVQSDKATLDEALNATHSDDLSEVSNGVATIDAETGKITLNKAVVNGTGGEDNKTSEVKAKAKDAYGNSSTEVSHSATHADPATPMVDRPNIEDLGSGKATITLGANNDGMVVETQGKKLTVSKGNDGKYEINPQDTAGVEIDPITGRVTITVTGNTEVPITVKGKKDSKESEPVTAKIDPTKDATPEHTDPVDLLPLENGDVEVKPGTDNKKIRISYTAPDGTAHNDVELVKGSDGNWTPSTRAEDFTVANGKITLKASAVKDMTEVTAIGNNGNQDQEGNASAYPFVDDVTAGKDGDSANPPSLAKASSNDDVVITKGADNHKMEIKYVPTGSADNNDDKLTTLTAQLEKGGKWSLKDKDGFDVPPEVATIDDNGNVT
ncbi:Ig-like domain-containing protein, partial [Ursidibacter sp. B-7004-1]